MQHLIEAARDARIRETALKLTLAAMLALAIAAGFGLTNPWWAAMATWMIGQPPRGLLLERSAAQLVGTVLGGAAAVLIALTGNLEIQLVLLAVWLAFCCGLSNAVRHQRSYGAALAGLTAAVIVALTAGTSIEPLGFTIARITDTLIGISASILVGFLFGLRSPGGLVKQKLDSLLADGLHLIGLALNQEQASLLPQEAIYLDRLSATLAGAEDAAAGSMSARSRLRPLHRLFAGLLDLIVLARMIRNASENHPRAGSANVEQLRVGLEDLSRLLKDTGTFQPAQLIALLKKTWDDLPELASLQHTFISELQAVAQSRDMLTTEASTPSAVRLRPHPDRRALLRAIARGFLAVAVTSAIWVATGWEAARFLVLGTSIFTVLFATLDQPLPLVRQGLAGGAIAAVLAVGWRLGIVPLVSAPWLSVALALPVFAIASLIQANRQSMFVGLTFNMFFAVMARHIDMAPSSPLQVSAGAGMLVAGVWVSDAIYRWILPMGFERRQRHLEGAIRREISFISLRAGTPWAERHLSRLRHLVLELVLRAKADPQLIGDAIAALSVGHAAVRFGEIRHGAQSPAAEVTFATQCLQDLESPLADPAGYGRGILAGMQLEQGAELTPTEHLRAIMAKEFVEHARIFEASAAR